MRKIYKFNEKNLTMPEAMGIFGLKTLPDIATLKKKYKELSLSSHPDRGGSTEKMQDINQAFEILKATLEKGGSSSFSKEYDSNFWDTIKKKGAEAAVRAEEMFKKDFDSEKMRVHLQQFIQEPLIADPVTFKKSTYSNYDGTIYASSKVHTQDNTTFFEIFFHISKDDAGAGGLSYTGIDENDLIFKIAVTTSIYHEKRSLKLGKYQYGWNAGHKAIIDPNEVFPPAKIKKALAGSKTKLFRKADMYLGLQRELPFISTGSDPSDIFIYPFGKDAKFYFHVSRMVLGALYGNSKDKLVYYSFGNAHYIDPQTQKYNNGRVTIAPGYSYQFMETEEDLAKLVEMVNEVQEYVKRRKINPLLGGEEIVQIFRDKIDKFFPKKN